MALFQVCGKVPEDRDRLSSLFIKSKKASGCFVSNMVGGVSNRQVVGFALVSSHPTSLRVTSLMDVIFERSFRKVPGTLKQSSGLNDLCMVSLFPQKKNVKPSAMMHLSLVGLGSAQTL